MLLSVALTALLVQGDAARPGSRNAHATAYDLRDSSLVLYGGATADRVLGDIWRWKSGAWRRVSP